MKRIKFISAIVPLVFVTILILQSCKEEEPVPQIFYAFTEPTAVTPLDGATIKITGTNVELKWASTDADGDSPIADVYFGAADTPPLYKTQNAGLSLTVPVELGKTYHWSVTMFDANKVMTKGPVWSFTVFEPIGIFVGKFNCDEPAEAYSYDISFTKATATSLATDNYWNSGWKATFNLDFTKNTYTMVMPGPTWSGVYSGVESGTIDPATGKMVGNYTIYKSGVSIETGVHTYTKK